MVLLESPLSQVRISASLSLQHCARNNQPLTILLFKYMCNSIINDTNVNVRINALHIISGQTVSTEMLLQTLSKKQMRISTEINPQDSEFNSDDLNISEASICGAFVHGLEDELKAIRVAAISTLNLT